MQYPPVFNIQRRILVTLVVRGMRQINIFVFSMGFIPALKIEASGGSQARKRKARRGKYASGVLDLIYIIKKPPVFLYKSPSENVRLMLKIELRYDCGYNI